MDSYTIMVVTDERSPIRRFLIPKAKVRNVAIGAAVAVFLLAVGLWDYTRVRADNVELGDLRVEVAEQREQIRSFEQTLGSLGSELEKVHEFERKVRIIANLPGAAGVGGEDVTQLVPLRADTDEESLALPPAGVPIPPAPLSLVVPGLDADPSNVGLGLEERGLTTLGARHLNELGSTADGLAGLAGLRGASLGGLLAQLEEKRTRLSSMPSVWPARGWLTSRFGPRTSPFTGRRQRHAGIDIAARGGTGISAPARGRVSSIGHRGPLGNSLTLDHGFGVKTFYGHTEEILVKVGAKVERGDRIATMGSSGRSTGPHLHYAVHVDGKARDPLNYIFD